jgi:hypothetical protein
MPAAAAAAAAASLTKSAWNIAFPGEQYHSTGRQSLMEPLATSALIEDIVSVSSQVICSISCITKRLLQPTQLQCAAHATCAAAAACTALTYVTFFELLVLGYHKLVHFSERGVP